MSEVRRDPKSLVQAQPLDTLRGHMQGSREQTQTPNIPFPREQGAHSWLAELYHPFQDAKGPLDPSLKIPPPLPVESLSIKGFRICRNSTGLFAEPA